MRIKTYDSGHLPVSGQNPDDDGRKRWASLPLKSDKVEAARLVHLLLTGSKKAEALNWINRRRYTPAQLENFIKSMQRGLAAKAEIQAPEHVNAEG